MIRHVIGWEIRPNPTSDFRTLSRRRIAYCMLFGSRLRILCRTLWLVMYRRLFPFRSVHGANFKLTGTVSKFSENPGDRSDTVRQGAPRPVTRGGCHLCPHLYSFSQQVLITSVRRRVGSRGRSGLTYLRVACCLFFPSSRPALPICGTNVHASSVT